MGPLIKIGSRNAKRAIFSKAPERSKRGNILTLWLQVWEFMGICVLCQNIGVFYIHKPREMLSNKVVCCFFMDSVCKGVNVRLSVM